MASMATPVIISSWSTTSPQTYWSGTTAVKINGQNLPGGTLLVVMTWDKTSDPNTPIAFVKDDAHNWYRMLEYGGTGPYMQVFIAPDAAVVDKLYVSTSTFTRNLHVHVLEVRGLPSSVSLAVGNVATGTNSTTMSVSMSNSATSAVGFAFAVADCANGAVINPTSSFGSTFHRIPGQGAPVTANPNDAVVGTFTPVTGTNTASWNTARGTFTSWTAISVILNLATAPVYHAAGNPNWPQVGVLAYFGYSPGAPASPLTGGTDISSRFLGVSGSRGRSFELDELEAADLTVSFDNADGALSPGNTASPYYPNFDLITPIDIFATWQGKQYYICSGYINAIPENYDFQRGMVKAELSDDFTKLPQVLLQSAMIADCLYDKPTHLWPMNDEQATFASNWSGRSTATLTQVNSKYGSAGTTGTIVPGFGATASFNGSQDSCYGLWAGLINGTKVPGNCLADRADSGLPWISTGATYEVWASILNTATTAVTGATIMALLDDKGSLAGGMFMKLVAVNVGTTASPVTVISCGHGSNGSEGMHTWRTTNVFDGGWHHYAVRVHGAAIDLYLDGQRVGGHSATVPGGKPTRICYGGDPTVPAVIYGRTAQQRRKLSGLGGLAGFFCGRMANAACYDRVLDPERIQSHYLSGHTGWNGELTGLRIQRVLGWANWAGPQAIDSGVAQQQSFNYLGGTYGSNGLTGAIGASFTAGGALLDSGSQADITIQDIAVSENGMLVIGADGTLSFRERSYYFTRTPAAIFGDLDYALNNTVSLNNGLGEWTSVSGGALSTTTQWSYGGSQSGLITCNGGVSQAFVRGNLNPIGSNAAIGVSCWAMSPTAAYAHIAIDWYNASGYMSTSAPPGNDLYLPPATPMQLTFGPVTPPGGATGFVFGPTVTQTPPAGVQLCFDHLRASPGGFQVPYDGDQAQITRDIQYLYNDIAITRNVDQSTFRIRSDASQAKYLKRTYTRVIYLGLGDPQGVVDSASWLLQDYSLPKPRVESLTVDAASNPELWPYVLTLDVGDIVGFMRNPVQGSAFAGNFLILGIETDFEADKAEWTYTLAPLPTGANGNVLVTDNSAIGAGLLGW